MSALPPRRIGSLALAWAVLAASPPAGADSLPSGFEARDYSYEFAGLDAFPDHLVIAYPVICNPSTGRSVASEVTRDERALAALLDYEILRPGRRYRAAHHCLESRVYVVERAGWTVEPIASAPGRSEDERDLVHVAELDALEADGRDLFFRDDRRVHATGFVFERDSIVPRGDPLRSIHDVLGLERVGEEFRVRGRDVTYTYRDGTRELLAYADGRRPQPAGKGNLPPDPSFVPEAEPPPEEPPPGDTEPEPAPPPATPLTPARPGESPTWPWLLAVGALMLAGLAGLRLRRHP